MVGKKEGRREKKMEVINKEEIIGKEERIEFGEGREENENEVIGEEGMRIENERRRGSGEGINKRGRLEKKVSKELEDGWEKMEEMNELKKEVKIEKKRKIIKRNDYIDI